MPAASPRHISVVFYTDASEVGGAELSLGNLLSALSPRIEATVVGTSEAVVAKVAAHCPRASTLVLAPIPGFTHLTAMLEHFRAFRRVRPDVLHVNLNATGASPWALAMGIAVPGVRVIAVEHLAHPIRRARRRMLARLLSGRLAAHVAVGQRAARDVARYLGRPERSVRTIHNGVPDVELEAPPRPSESSVIGSIGRLDGQKAYDVLVRALPQLPDVTAVVIGEGEERGRLEELADSLGVADRLLLPGWSDEPRQQLRTFDVFVLPSRVEGLPLVLVEAMLAGVPVVATDVGSVAEAVVDGSTGLLVPPGDTDALVEAIASLLGDPGLRREMGARGRERALELFSVAAMAARYEALYDEVLA